MRVAQTIELGEHTELELRVLVKRRTVEARLQQRALVALWRERFLGGGIDALRKDAQALSRPAVRRQTAGRGGPFHEPA